MWSFEGDGSAIRPVALDEHEGPVLAAAVAPDGRLIATGGEDKSVRAWQISAGGQWTPQLLEGHKGAVVSMVFSFDGSKLVPGSVDGTARIWRRMPDGKWVSDALTGHKGAVRVTHVGPRGLAVLTGGDDGTVRVWSKGASDWRFKTLGGHPDGVTAVAMSPEGERILTGGGDGTVRLWRGKAGGDWTDEVLLPHDGAVRVVRFAPGGQTFITASDDGTARLWRREANRWKPEVLAGHQGPIEFATYYPGRERILTISSVGNGAARLWQRDLTGHWVSSDLTTAEGVLAGAVSPDGRWLVISNRATPMASPVARLHDLRWLTLGEAPPAEGDEPQESAVGVLAREICRERLAGRIEGRAEQGNERVLATVTTDDLRAVHALRIAGVKAGQDVCGPRADSIDLALSRFLPPAWWSELGGWVDKGNPASVASTPTKSNGRAAPARTAPTTSGQ